MPHELARPGAAAGLGAGSSPHMMKPAAAVADLAEWPELSDVFGVQGGVPHTLALPRPPRTWPLGRWSAVERAAAAGAFHPALKALLRAGLGVRWWCDRRRWS